MKLLRAYLSLGVIIGTLPETIANGEIIDAVPIMANFDYIVSQVNTNVGTEGLSLTSMTTTTRDALTGVTLGRLIFNSTAGKLQVCTNATGPVWQTVTSA